MRGPCADMAGGLSRDESSYSLSPQAFPQPGEEPAKPVEWRAVSVDDTPENGGGRKTPEKPEENPLPTAVERA